MVSRIAALSAIIADNTAKIDTFLVANNLPNLSFDEDVPLELYSNPDFARTRHATLEATRELQALLQGSHDLLWSRPVPDMAYLDALTRLDIFAKFEKSSDRATYQDIANSCSIPEPEARRLIRGAMSAYVFKEETPGIISHTAASKILATNALARQWVQMRCAELWPAVTRAVDAIFKWPGSEEPTETGYQIANNTADTFFMHMNKFSGRGDRFADAMKYTALNPNFKPDFLASHYPWDAVGPATIVDLGGSHGQCSIPIVRKFSNVRIIVQDLPEVIADADVRLPEDVQGKISFAAHDFFTEQTVSADVYILRWILHDWSDKYALRILRALIPALKEGARIILNEWILPVPGDVPTMEESKLRQMDMLMRAQGNGKEREAQDWATLVTAADPRFHLHGITKPTGSSMGIIEIVWQPVPNYDEGPSTAPQCR